MSEPYLIMKRGFYYRPDYSGYTGIRDLAGRYSRDDAVARAIARGVTYVRLADAPEFAPACADEMARIYLAEKREEARVALARLVHAVNDQGGDALLSEGQVARITGLDLVAVRELHDLGRDLAESAP